MDFRRFIEGACHLIKILKRGNENSDGKTETRFSEIVKFIVNNIREENLYL